MVYIVNIFFSLFAKQSTFSRRRRPGAWPCKYAI